MKWRFIICWKQRRQAELLAGGGLSASEAEAAQAHLAHCLACRQHYLEMIDLTRQLRAWSQSVPLVEPSQAAHERWMRAITADDTTEPAEWPRLGLDWRRVLAGVTAVWVLAVFFRVMAPEVGPMASNSTLASPRDVLAAIKLPLQVVVPWSIDQKPVGDIKLPWPARQPADRSPRSDRQWPHLAG